MFTIPSYCCHLNKQLTFFVEFIMSSTSQRIPARRKISNKNRSISTDSSRSINTDAELELLQSDDETATQKIEILSSNLESVSAMDVDISDTSKNKKEKSGKAKSTDNSSNNQILNLLTDIKQQQFTKKDGMLLKKVCDKKFLAIDSELKTHSTLLAELDSRMNHYDSKFAAADYERELQKQNALKNNISIFGCSKSENEDLKKTVIKIFNAFGIKLDAADFVSVYRTTGKRPSFSSIIVKFASFDKKLSVLNAKANKPIKCTDVFGAKYSDNTQIYLNNHVTPFFGRLLAAGRAAVKEEIIHSCWIGSNGCLIKLLENGKPMIIRSTDDFDVLKKNAEGKSNHKLKKYKRSKPDDPTSPADQNSSKR